ncbi:hypothetical protein HanRHA438_Chr02g0062131 [Helianthus annuus]|nr:hypothetical protein HanHA89_Chr02g0053531 [Helianthus annuus]KAJ0776909.1 hypothetical protein HanLR1_Chr02g0051111 [Helianthus annuus]KAJ0939527.1 hypothetical protein HanRHA438_Chr02g0062131 [Helianthus annuus]
MATTAKNNRTPTGVLQSFTTKLILYAKHAIKSSKNKATTRPKKLMSSISNKAIKLCHRKKTAGEDENDGVWRKEILMGDKCQPLDFSGVIYYDKDGNLTTEFPIRSPRASPFLGYGFSPAKSGWTTTAR